MDQNEKSEVEKLARLVRLLILSVLWFGIVGGLGLTLFSM